MFKKLIAQLHIFTKKNSKSPPLNHKQEFSLAEASPALATYTPDPAALKIIFTLQQAGFEAYIVGGAVRDLILGEKPKDYDIVTNAEPEQIRTLFRRARIIGKRFPLVHIFSGGQITEVATYRKESKKTNADGRIITDNQFGDIDTDACRRDFTCNALYLDPAAAKVISYHEALAHLQQKKLMMIGDPHTRVREDPIRIIRGVRIAQKLNLAVDTDLLTAFKDNAALLLNESPSRLFDEWVKILYCRQSLGCFYFFSRHGMLPYIHPLAHTLSAYQDKNDLIFIEQVLRQSDERRRHEQTVSLSFVLAALLWPLVRRERRKQLASGHKQARALHEAVVQVIATNKSLWEIPHRNLAGINEIWRLQGRLENLKTPQQLQKVSRNGQFRAAYNFFLLRGENGEINLNNAAWWINTVKKMPASVKTKTPARHYHRR